MKKRNNLIYGILLLLFGCTNVAEQQQKNELTHFDIKGYFEQEVKRLTKEQPLISKTVDIDGSKETKKMRISNWEKELTPFSNADINRNSWKDEFVLSKTKDLEIYTSNNEKVPVKQISIYYKADKPYGFSMLIENKNALYTSVDSLTYYPDSLYQIKKAQDIRLLNKKRYSIIGRF